MKYLTRKNITGALVGLAVVVASVVAIQQPYNPMISVYISPTGNDSGQCTATAPCRTFGRAQNVAGNGWFVVFRDGVYPAFVITKNGITAIADGDVTIDANNASRAIDVPTGVTDVSIIGFKVINSSSHSIHIRGTRTLVKDNQVYNGIWENANVSNRQITSCRSSGWGSGIKGAVGAVDMTVIGNKVYNNCGEGIALTRVLGGLVEYNVVYDNFSVGIYVDNSNGVTVRNNHAFCTNDTRFYRGGDPMRGITLGVENYSGWGNQMGNILVESNYVDRCRGIRMYNYFSGNPPNLVIRNNWFTGVPDTLIIVSGAVLSNNTVGTPPQSWFDAFSSVPTPTMTRTPSPIPPTVTRTPTATRTPSITPSRTPTASRTPTGIPSVTVTPSVTPECELIYTFENGDRLLLCKP